MGIRGKQWKQCQTLFWGAPKSLQVLDVFSLETPQRKWASSRLEGRTSWIFSIYGRCSRLTMGTSPDVRSPKHMSFLQKDGRLVPEAGAQPFRGRALGPGFDSDTLPPSHPPLESVRLWELRELNPCPAQSFFF